jgi:hypothetical protein
MGMHLETQAAQLSKSDDRLLKYEKELLHTTGVESELRQKLINSTQLSRRRNINVKSV